MAPSPNAGSVSDELRGVSAVSASDAWAVGLSVVAATRRGRTLTEHWDGAAWTVVPSPNLSPDNNRLTAVAAVSADDVWAVGVAGLGTLVEHWDGAVWEVVASPNLPSVTPSTR